MANLPSRIKQRNELDCRLGIKSSLSGISSVIALVYLLYCANGKNSEVIYADEVKQPNGKRKLIIKEQYKRWIIDNYGVSENIINNNPLLNSQLEALQVGLGLMFHLAKISYVDFPTTDTKERAGGERFRKRMQFALNMKSLDLYLSAWSNDEQKEEIVAWLNNKETSSSLSNGLKQMLTIFSEETQFKIRYQGQDVIFQQIGIYDNFSHDDRVVAKDAQEGVGPFRIFKNFVREGLHPCISLENNEFLCKDKDGIENYRQMVETTLDLSPRKIVVYQEVQVEKESNEIQVNKSLQQIYYGAPGTGKSFAINNITKKYSAIRTTFHPDSDYSTFVGAYKPTMEDTPVYGAQGVEVAKEKRITYSFVKQAFLKAYLAAWKKYAEGGDSAEPQFLIIEEINRGNCAQIFGDLFQLLDRSDNGFSTYPIEADADLQKEIEKAFTKEEDYLINGDLSVDGVVKDYTSNYGASLSEDIKNGRVLLLPNNLYIWATMNTSDQSLFPIDSAFKRRWDWKYVRITNGYERDEDGKRKLDDNGKPIPLEWKIDVDGEQYDWWQFVQDINVEIADKTDSDDKKLGYFFCKAKDKKIDAETFVGKVIFYLWNDVFKDENADIFNLEGVGKVTFDQFYTEDEQTGETKVNETMTGAFIKKVLEAHKIPDMNTNGQE